MKSKREPKSLLDLMSPESREKALKKAEKRLARRESSSNSVSPELYIIAELGYYYGWDAIMAVRRGYVLYLDEKMEEKKHVFTLQEAIALNEAAKKVWYSKLIEHGHASLVANTSVYSKNPAESFNKGVAPFEDRAKVG